MARASQFIIALLLHIACGPSRPAFFALLLHIACGLNGPAHHCLATPHSARPEHASLSYSLCLNCGAPRSVNGVPEWLIQARGRWSSDCFRPYTRALPAQLRQVAHLLSSQSPPGPELFWSSHHFEHLALFSLFIGCSSIFPPFNT